MIQPYFLLLICMKKFASGKPALRSSISTRSLQILSKYPPHPTFNFEAMKWCWMNYQIQVSLCNQDYKIVNDCIAWHYCKLCHHKWTNKILKTEKQRQQGHILILNYVYVLWIHEKTELKKRPRKTGNWWFLHF